MQDITVNELSRIFQAALQEAFPINVNSSHKVANIRHTCWYRVTATQKGRSETRIFIVASLIMDIKTPFTSPEDARKNSEIIWDAEFLSKLEQASNAVILKAKDLARAAGATFKVYMKEPPAALKKYHHPSTVREGDYTNFLGLDILLPYAPGQKKQIQTLLASCKSLSSEFATFMTIKEGN